MDKLKIGLMHYKNIHLHQSNAALKCLFQPYVWSSVVVISIPESMHYFNQFVYAGYAAKSVKAKPRSKW